MKAVRFHEYGPSNVLAYDDVEVPEPGAGEVLIRMRACGVNHFDVDVRSGVSRWPLPLPHQLGVEFAGGRPPLELAFEVSREKSVFFQSPLEVPRLPLRPLPGWKTLEGIVPKLRVDDQHFVV